MRRKCIVVGTSLWLMGALCIGSGMLSGESDGKLLSVARTAKQSEETQQEIDAANKKREQLEKEKEDLERTLESSERQKANILKYITTLDSKMENLTKKIKANEVQIDLVQADIDSLVVEEAQVVAKKNNQYETMKARIKYMYEDGNASYLELLAESGSLSEMYNHLEYISKISEYDKKMYGEYENTQKKLIKTQDQKKSKMEELVAAKEALSFEKDSISKLVGRKKDQLTQYDNVIKDSESSISAYDAKIAAQENEVENLLAKQRREIAAEEAAAAKNPASDTTPGDGQTQANNTVSTKGFLWPLPVSGRISCGFGPRVAPTKGASTYHRGIDIAVPSGTVVRAAKEGKVVTATYSSSAGNYVAIYHGGGLYTYYMHNSSLSVSVGDEVTRGQTVALSGSTGISTGPHLHFAIFLGGTYVNPLNYVSQ